MMNSESTGEARVRIRSGKRSDVVGIALCYLDEAAHEFNLYPEFVVTPTKSAAIDSFLSKLDSVSNDVQVLVAEHDGEIVGFVEVHVGEVDEPGHSRYWRLFSFMHDIGVRMEHRVQGIGRRLADAAEAWARDRGSEIMFLGVLTRNESAILFYEGLGYQATGVMFHKALINEDGD